MKIGVQFYTVREFCKTEEGLSESLKRAADIGYTAVQLSGVCPYDPEWMREELQKNGLECVITHTDPGRLITNTEEVCREHITYGCRNIGIGMLPSRDFSKAGYEGFLSDFLPAAKTMKEKGCKLYYHNHYHEFRRDEDGERMIDKLLRDFPPELLGITFDTYWAQYAGADPAAWLEKLSGRAECIHLKDMDMVGSEQRMAAVGRGNMNFPRIIKAAEAAGSKYLLVEQDNCYGEDPFECLKQSYEYLTSLGLN